MLEHGGQLRDVARRTGTPWADWLDLSTGISPWSWAAETGFAPTAESWRRLPDDDDGLRRAAADYYGGEVLPTAGSQAAIQALPRLRPAATVGICAPTYAEHAEQWGRAGHAVVAVAADRIAQQLDHLDVLLLCNPNNPDGRTWTPATLLDWHARLAARGGWLVVDEAYIDAQPERSIAARSDRPGLIVLRSLGKFFGLAGARVGFVGCAPGLRAALREALGPWPVAGPAREMAMAALRDHPWQQRQRQRLHAASAALAADLVAAGLTPAGGCSLFHRVVMPDAVCLHAALARQGIWVRRFASPASLRFGLPGDAPAALRLRRALQTLARGAA
ncbi:MAG: threonine-phosphate decarboxylase CobD [Pseudomonadota bacterium]|nr:threonine-phosphate decarboxylase CobD [Pseudomonadota bacterium]